MNRYIKRTLIVLATAFCIAVIGLISLRLYIDHYLKIGFLAEADVRRLMVEVNRATALMQQRNCTPVAVDVSSIGDRKREAEMLDVAFLVNFYAARFGDPPKSVAELNRLGVSSQ